MAITHAFTSAVDDGVDDTVVQPSDWNAEHAGTLDAASVTFTPTTAADWDGDADPGDLDDALNQLAERVDDNEIAIAALPSILELQVFM